MQMTFSGKNGSPGLTGIYRKDKVSCTRECKNYIRLNTMMRSQMLPAY